MSDKCESCQGTGLYLPGREVPCRSCDGTGWTHADLSRQIIETYAEDLENLTAALKHPRIKAALEAEMDKCAKSTGGAEVDCGVCRQLRRVYVEAVEEASGSADRSTATGAAPTPPRLPFSFDCDWTAVCESLEDAEVRWQKLDAFAETLGLRGELMVVGLMDADDIVPGGPLDVELHALEDE